MGSLRHEQRQLSNPSAESGFEYYTPHEWTDAAREVMGGIDLDPASCEFANQWIDASRIFTKDNDGLQQEWHGRVWMNHPFHRGETACKAKCKKLTCQRRGHHITEDIPGNAEWINKLVSEYKAGRVTEAVVICYCSSSETWFGPLLKQPQCFPDGRIHYIGEDGKKVQGNTKGSVITYFGPNVARFAEVFGKLGEVKVAYQPGEKLAGISAALLNMIEQRASELAQQYASATLEHRPDDAEPGEEIGPCCPGCGKNCDHVELAGYRNFCQPCFDQLPPFPKDGRGYNPEQQSDGRWLWVTDEPELCAMKEGAAA